MGATLGLASIAIIIDHTQHRLPQVEQMSGQEQDNYLQESAPCGLGAAPCSLGGSSYDD